MSKYIIQLNEESQFKAILIKKLAYGVPQFYFNTNYENVFSNIIEKIIVEYPKLRNRLMKLELIKMEPDVLYCQDKENKIFYIIIRGPYISHYKITDNLINKGLKKNSEKKNRIYKYYKDFKLEYIEHKFEIIGYSSSANIAEWIGSQDESLNVTSFNPSVFDYELSSDKQYHNITRYMIKGDILSSKMNLGKIYEYPISGIKFDTFIQKLLYYHDISHFINDISDFEIINYDKEPSIEENFEKEKIECLTLIESKIKNHNLPTIKEISKKNIKTPNIKPLLPKTIPPSLTPPLPPSCYKNKLYTGINSYRSTNFRSYTPPSFHSYQPNATYTGFTPNPTPFINSTNCSLIDNLTKTTPTAYNAHDLKYTYDGNVF